MVKHNSSLVVVQRNIEYVEQLVELSSVNRTTLVSIELVEHACKRQRALGSLIQFFSNHGEDIIQFLACGKASLAIARRHHRLGLDERRRTILPVATKHASISAEGTTVNGALLLPGLRAAWRAVRHGAVALKAVQVNKMTQTALRVHVVIPWVGCLKAIGARSLHEFRAPNALNEFCVVKLTSTVFIIKIEKGVALVVIEMHAVAAQRMCKFPFVKSGVCVLLIDLEVSPALELGLDFSLDCCNVL
mmetsp:Transcript_46975/g.75685  ORF Transcript_46975/g.75685 Transcript_46975/m.75685 type:complete len:247 (+) Transcript_46975:554-1294(+)